MGRDLAKYQNTTRLLKSLFEKALLIKEQQATKLKEQHGFGHAETLEALIKLLRIYDIKGDKARATEVRGRAFQGAIQGLSLENPAFVAFQEYLRNYYSKHNDVKALLSLAQQLYGKAVKEFGTEDRRSRAFEINLLRALRWNNQIDEVIRRGDVILSALEQTQLQNQDDVLTVLFKEVTAAAHLDQGMRKQPGYQNHFQTAASLFEHVLLSPKTRSVMGDRWFLRCTRKLRNCYLSLKFWPQAIERAAEVMKGAIAIHGRYSEEELNALDDLLYACWGAKEYTRSFNLGLMRCDHALEIGKGCTVGVLQVVMDQYELYKQIIPAKEDCIKMFNLLWQIREKGRDLNLVEDGRDYGAGLDEALYTLEGEVPADWKVDLEDSKSTVLDVESLQSLLRTNNPETVSFEVEEGWEKGNQSQNGGIGAFICISPDGGMCTVLPSSITGTGTVNPDKMTNVHNLCDQMIEERSKSEPTHHTSSQTNEDPNSWLYGEVDRLMIDIHDKKAKLVSDDLSDKELFSLLEELRTRRLEELYMQEICLPADDCFEDWPSLRDKSGTESNNEENLEDD